MVPRMNLVKMSVEVLEEANRRTSLKAVGFVQICLGCGALVIAIIDVSMDARPNAPEVLLWCCALGSGVGHVFLGLLAMYMTLQTALPSRKLLGLCVYLNIATALLSFVALTISILGVNGVPYVNGTFTELVLLALVICSYLAILNLPTATIPRNMTMASSSQVGS